MGDYEGKTLLNILIGAVITLVVSVVPAVQAIAPAVGGGVAGYLQNRGIGGGIKVGAGVTLVFIIPAAVLIVVFSSFIAAVVPMVGAGMLTGTVLFAVLFAVFFASLVLSVIGGAVGGLIAESSESDGGDTDTETEISVDTGN